MPVVTINDLGEKKEITQDQANKLKEGLEYLFNSKRINPEREYGKKWFENYLESTQVNIDKQGRIEIDCEGHYNAFIGIARSDGATTFNMEF